MTDIQILVTLMTIWWVWHVHNEITHDKPGTTIEASRRFLSSYIQTLLLCEQHPNADTTTGKHVNSTPETPWTPPEPGRTKLNVDGSFAVDSGKARVGFVLKDDRGRPIMAASRSVKHCNEPLEAELKACAEGLQAVKMLGEKDTSRSGYRDLLLAIKDLTTAHREVTVRKISRYEASDFLAKRGRLSDTTNCRMGDYPIEVVNVMNKDCNPFD
ncbi:hypothetical protein BRADI_5g21342v3 [Brachypodium distachyon]|uniref:RNase H type-1 domain-containing protein n=1 Tax=Brachypodium distachyon TaxID=15368 RepID=A0A0Q3IED9_BRADI|nr:hypothetical protein BRADI_5g21342v3 [Brachypodium distachyon]